MWKIIRYAYIVNSILPQWSCGQIPPLVNFSTFDRMRNEDWPVPWHIERLQKSHDRAAFNCGKPPLDAFITRFATQYEKRELARTFVLVEDDRPRVLGYYSLAASSAPFESLPPDLGQRLPHHPIPAVLLARLAVDQTAHKQGHGARLLRDAIVRILGIADVIGVYLLVVDAIDEEAAGFYERFGFTRFADQPDRLFIPVETLRKSVPPTP
jgi:GNAT superfamily N-acetyltransferase